MVRTFGQPVTDIFLTANRRKERRNTDVFTSRAQETWRRCPQFPKSCRARKHNTLGLLNNTNRSSQWRSNTLISRSELSIFYRIPSNRTLRQRWVRKNIQVTTYKSNTTSARLNPVICQEVDAAVRHYLPLCNDWTEVNINSKLVEIVAKVSGFIFVGPDLSSDPEYLDCGSNYTVRLMDAVNAIKQIRPWLRPFLVPRLPEIARLREMEERAAKHLKPIVLERLAAMKDDPNWQRPDDMLQWLLNRNADTSVEMIARTQLSLIFAAIHTTTLTATSVLYTLAVTPECIEPLREEIRNAMHENDGVINSRALQSMIKLDSYMKEVIRVYTPFISTSLPSLFTSSLKLIAHSLLQPPRPQRHHPLQRPIHPRRGPNRSPRRRRLRRQYVLPQRLHLRRLQAREAARRRHGDGQCAQPVRYHE